MKIIFMVLTLFSCFFCPTISASGSDDCVILLHGLGRTRCSMFKLEEALKSHHYIVINQNYPSTKKSMEEVAEVYIPFMVTQCLKHHPKHIHFVTHSIGGIILERYLEKNRLPQLDHIVMMSPPNHGSPWVDLFQNKWFLEFLLGPSIDQLATSKRDISLIQGPYKIGVIAGSYNLNPLGRIVFNEPNDGKVAVSSTKMRQMDDFIALPVTHTFMMRNNRVEKQILYFLQHGHFIHTTPLPKDYIAQRVSL
jgi:predicted alpha/beta hydrolase family esterase